MKLLERLRILKKKEEKKPDIKQAVKILPHKQGWIVNGEKILK